MADRRDILRRFRCRRLRPLLVDAAEGRLDPSRQKRLGRHLDECSECAAALAALREIPAQLRADDAAERGDAFWLQQRRSIMRAVRQQPAPSRRRWFESDFGWRAAVLAAAAVVIVVAGYRALRHPTVPRVQMAANINDLDAGTIVALADVAQTLVPSADLTPGGSWWDDEMVDGGAAAGQQQKGSSPLEDFSDEELETLNGLVGAMPG